MNNWHNHIINDTHKHISNDTTTEIITQRSHHGLSYFHLNDVLVDVIPVVLARHAVVDVILSQVVLAGGNTHTHTNTRPVRWTQPQLNAWMPCLEKHIMSTLNCSDRWKVLSSQIRMSSLCFMSTAWIVMSVFQTRVHSTWCSQTSTEFHYWVAFPFLCVFFFFFLFLWHPGS